MAVSTETPMTARTVGDIADEAVGILFNLALAGESPTTYYALAAALRHPASGLTRVLGEVGRRCNTAKIPPLTSFVVAHDTGNVLIGYSQVAETPAPIARIQAHAWARGLYAPGGQWAHHLFAIGLDKRPPMNLAE